MRLDVEFPSGPEGRWRTMSEEGVVCVGHSSHHTGSQEESQEGVAQRKPLERKEGEISEEIRREGSMGGPTSKAEAIVRSVVRKWSQSPPTSRFSVRISIIKPT